MSSATSGYGCFLKRGDGGGPEVFTTIAEVVNFSIPYKQEMIDVTSMSSSGGWRERIPTLKDGGTMQIDVNFLPQNATQSYSAGVLADFMNKTLRNFKIVFSDSGATSWTLPGYVTDFEITANVDSKLSARMSITLTGAPTLA